MSELIQIRKTVTHVETIRHEGGPTLEEPLKKGAIMIVLRNPYAGSFVEDVMPMMDALKPSGLEAAHELISLLGGVDRIKSYGKGAIVGESGELRNSLPVLAQTTFNIGIPDKKKNGIFLNMFVLHNPEID